MKRILIGSVLTILCSAGAWATPADCMAAASLADLIADNAVGGCQHQDKIFSNWAYTGTGNEAPNLVQVVHEFTAGSTADIHGWEFSTPGGFTAGFTLSYTVTVDLLCVSDGNCGPLNGVDTSQQTIFASLDQEQSGIVPNNTAVTDTQTIAGVLMLSGMSVGAETSQMTYTGVTSLDTVSVYTTSGTSAMQTYEQNFFEQSVGINPLSGTPEPATLALCGAALVLIGFLKKYRAS